MLYVNPSLNDVVVIPDPLYFDLLTTKLEHLVSVFSLEDSLLLLTVAVKVADPVRDNPLIVTVLSELLIFT